MSEPLGFLIPHNEEIICGDSGQCDEEADPGAKGVRVEGEKDHEEAGEGEQGRDEQRHLGHGQKKTASLKFKRPAGGGYQSCDQATGLHPRKPQNLSKQPVLGAVS